MPHSTSCFHWSTVLSALHNELFDVSLPSFDLTAAALFPFLSLARAGSEKDIACGLDGLE